MLTLKDLQTAQFQTASGFCTGSTDFMELVNLAVDELMKRGDWPGTVVPVRVCVRNGCVTWPRYVGQIRSMNHCKGTIAVRNVWWEFLDHSDGHRGIYAWNSWTCGQANMAMQFRAPTYNDIYGPNCTVRIYPMVPSDIGKQVVIFGTDNNGQPLSTDNGDGTYSPGAVITLALPFGSTNTFVSTITRVVKPVTQGRLNMFAYDSVQNALYDLAYYDPSETNPDYLRYQLEGLNRYEYGVNIQPSCQSNDCLKSVVALVKLANLPIITSTDLVIINDKRALLNAIRALKAEDSSNPGLAGPFWRAAVEGLNRNLENESPDEQISVQNKIWGDGSSRRNHCW